MPTRGAFPYHPKGACQALPKHVSSEQSVIINRNTAVPPPPPVIGWTIVPNIQVRIPRTCEYITGIKDFGDVI